jgi:hypothetical protein
MTPKPRPDLTTRWLELQRRSRGCDEACERTEVEGRRVTECGCAARRTNAKGSS